MGTDFTAKLDGFEVTGTRIGQGVARSVDGAIHVAWGSIPDEHQERKREGLRVTLVVGGGNPIGWYGVILSTSS